MSKVVVPEVIDLKRIRLRRPRLADAEAIYEYGSDPEVARYADWPIRTNIESLIESLRERTESSGADNKFSWVITLIGEDRAIGGVTCTIVGDSAEIGFLLNRRYWGQGLATEGTQPIVEWALSCIRFRCCCGHL